MGVEIIGSTNNNEDGRNVMPREGHGSRNPYKKIVRSDIDVMPREGHGSRNFWYLN